MSEERGGRRLFRLPVSEGRIGREIEDEIAFHLEARASELMRRGASPEEARAGALGEFGDIHEARRELERMARRRARRRERADWLSDLGQDVRYGVRAALNAPLFSLLAILTLALGIGANAAVFGVVKAVLLDALPYAESDRLVRIYGRMLDGTQERGAISAGTANDLRERQTSFTELATFVTATRDVAFGGEDGRTRLARVTWVEPGLFRTLGVAPQLGRDFTPADAVGEPLQGHLAGPETVLVTASAWRRLLGGEPAAVGREVLLNGTARTVVGVLPDGFVGPLGEAAEPDFYLALDLQPVLANAVSSRASHWLGIVGRLREGVTVEAARREVGAIGAQLAQEHPRESGSMGITAMPIRDALMGDTRRPLVVLLASAGLVLLIACANLASALLSRTLSRRKEFAVRASLGAGRGRVVRQLLTESTLLAVAGGVAGLLLAVLALDVVRGLAAHALPPYAELGLDPGAIAVTGLLALATGLLFGVAPALSIGRANLQDALREEGRGASEGRRSQRLRGGLVAGQIALCVSLLAGAGLLARSLWEMTRTPLGFDPSGVAALSVELPTGRYSTPEAWTRFQEQSLERLRGLAGVDAAASVSMVPTRVLSSMGLSIVDRPHPTDAQPFVLYATVSDDYFRTLRIPVVEGRTFDARDHANAPGTIVISETMARRYWPDGEALGARIRLGPDPSSAPLEVIGIVGDVRNDPVRQDADPMAYHSIRQGPWPIVSFLLRTDRDPTTLVRPAERALADIDPMLPIHGTGPLRGVIAEGFAGRRLPTALLTAFGILALVLASVGVYAMFATMAAARTQEFGIRRALGSDGPAIARLVLRQGGVWMGLGLAAGAVGIAAVSRLVRPWLYGVPALDPLALAVAIGALIACAAVAMLVPVRRAARVDPATALRG